jgi:hypothetical protein
MNSLLHSTIDARAAEHYEPIHGLGANQSPGFVTQGAVFAGRLWEEKWVSRHGATQPC